MRDIEQEQLGEVSETLDRSECFDLREGAA